MDDSTVIVMGVRISILLVVRKVYNGLQGPIVVNQHLMTEFLFTILPIYLSNINYINIHVYLSQSTISSQRVRVVTVISLDLQMVPDMSLV